MEFQTHIVAQALPTKINPSNLLRARILDNTHKLGDRSMKQYSLEA